ncbi:hypothetical protein [Pyrobaculum aerophilum]|uniref:hypothetical protein n=1 Tax=Pyrobaculum aerophilum TaxID=13773 RepID=UPI0023F04E72|nr:MULTISPECIES: hypothetical protein [Pyrobaculum]MCX8136186.1 hypothetical protein [Pyrobaculum aerophilum]
MARFFKYPFFRMGLALGVMSFFHLFLFSFLREGLLLAAVVSYFSAYGVAYNWRWVLPWVGAVVAGVFVSGRAVAALVFLLYLASMLAVPLFFARGVWNRFKSLFFFVLGHFLSGVPLLLISPLWRSLVPHPFGFVDFGPAIPTPVDWPWYFVGYYVWERIHSLYKGRPRGWGYFTQPEG